ncbi:hypothetical protein GH810_09915 [Acetobacterium paludosum]|uniref:VanZ-like domain-containing protein n=1 Tax=Acetobacterium paludosum TaxID=52693 RepID=A0A923HXU8_9FIRM|nr:VanZ family protein [Acetobacterium paludosum]MBC3888624.1 hypothetical protein [Acetobacterium paludosum]
MPINAMIKYYNLLCQYGPFSNSKDTLMTMLIVFMLLAVLILNKTKWTTKEKWCRPAIWFYVYLIFLYTVLARTGKTHFDYNLNPFWTYQYIWETHDFRLVLEVIFNCLMFIPVGILIPLAYENNIDEDETKKRNTVILLGFLISVSVECLQLFTKTGMFEWDDIIHDTIGVIVGYGIYLYLKNQIRGEDHQKLQWYFLPFSSVLVALIVAMIY